jgi:methionyl-tRNA formyltransferase
MPLRIALFGQAPLAVDCLERLLTAGHTVAGVFSPPDGGRPDPLAERARAHGLRVIQRRYFQRKDGSPVPSALAEYAPLAADVNVLASMTSFLPLAIADAPRHRSVCFHPSLLPRYRGGNALQWQIISGESETGVSVFVPDRGVDTGPLVVARGGVAIDDDDTTATLFFKKLAPLGAEALVRAVELIDRGEAAPWAQDESCATHQGLVDDAVSAIDFSCSAREIDRLVRGCDPQPGAWARFAGEPLRLFDARLLEPAGDTVVPGTVLDVTPAGLRIALHGGVLAVGRVRGSGPKEPAAAFAARVGLRPGSRLEGG